MLLHLQHFSGSSRTTAHSVLTVALVLVGCATIQPDSLPARPDTIPPAAKRSTAIELATLNALSAYEVVARLRPDFLIAARAATPEAQRVVYVDGVRLGGIERLREIPAGMVEEIRFLSGIEATTRYGAGHSEGALVVTTRPGPR
jgi:hypothetical protein